MSLRRRLLITLGLSLMGLWLVASAWLLVDLNQTVRHTLDQRLIASARMVSGLMEQMPDDAWRSQSMGAAMDASNGHGIACQIRSMKGEVLLRNRGDMGAVFANAQPGFSDQRHQGHRWRVYTQVHNNLNITVADRLDERRDLQWGIVVVAALPFVVALVGSLMITWWGIRRGLAPLDRLREELARRDPETLSPVNIQHAPAELQPVIDTLNELLSQTDETLRREQRFTSNAAHELRTPLTAIKTHVQLARRSSQDKSRVALDHAEAGVGRLQETLEQLLLLTRVESDQGHEFGRTPARIGHVIQAAVADLGLPASFAEKESRDTRLLAVPEQLAVSALRNLLDNAVQHSGAVETVRLTLEDNAGYITFQISDEGQAERAPVAQRFERGAHSQGSGLGLSIVTAIATRFGGQLQIVSQTPRGTCARLTLPMHSA